VSNADLRHVWADFGWWLMPNGTRRLLSWNAATKELRLWALHSDQRGDVLAVLATEDEVTRRLEGWAEYNDTKEGLSWLASRLEGCR
jgi:hypothetical protein